ncbi:hypothetical protein [Sinorhizobium americanum]|nr:hypothetical protein [Sinorhizobium americanum]
MSRVVGEPCNRRTVEIFESNMPSWSLSSKDNICGYGEFNPYPCNNSSAVIGLCEVGPAEASNRNLGRAVDGILGDGHTPSMQISRGYVAAYFHRVPTLFFHEPITTQENGSMDRRSSAFEQYLASVQLLRAQGSSRSEKLMKQTGSRNGYGCIEEINGWDCVVDSCRSNSG